MKDTALALLKCYSENQNDMPTGDRSRLQPGFESLRFWWSPEMLADAGEQGDGELSALSAQYSSLRRVLIELLTHLPTLGTGPAVRSLLLVAPPDVTVRNGLLESFVRRMLGDWRYSAPRNCHFMWRVEGNTGFPVVIERYESAPNKAFAMQVELPPSDQPSLGEWLQAIRDYSDVVRSAMDDCVAKHRGPPAVSLDRTAECAEPSKAREIAESAFRNLSADELTALSGQEAEVLAALRSMTAVA
jgi:hypothetical protein